MTAPTLRRVVRVLAAAGLVALALLAALHTAPGRERVRAWVETRASAALGARVTLAGLDYNLLTLRVTAHGLDVRFDDGAPLIEAERVTVNLPASVVLGERHLQGLELVRPRLHLAGLRRWLARRPDKPAPAARPGPFTLGGLQVLHLDIIGAGPATTGVDLDLRDLTVASRPDTDLLVADLTSGSGVIALGTHRIGLTGLSGTARFDGERVHAAPLRVTTAGSELTAAGSVALLTATPEWRLAITGHVRAEDLLGAWSGLPQVTGAVTVEARVTGALAAPSVVLHATADQLVVGNEPLTELSAELTTGAVNEPITARFTSTALGGNVTATVRTDRAFAMAKGELRWTGLDLARALRAAGVVLPRTSRSSGTATFAGALDTPASWEATAEAVLASSSGTGTPARGRVTAGLRGGHWHAAVRDARLGGTSIDLEASGALSPGEAVPVLHGSTLRGTARLETSDLAGSLADLGHLGIPVPRQAIDQVAGTLSLRVTLGGTLGRPDVRAELERAALDVPGLGATTVTGMVVLDAGRVLRLEDVVLRTRGPGKLRLHGTVDLRSDTLQLDLEGSDLPLAGATALLLPQGVGPGRGVLDGRGHVTGTLARPETVVALSARDIDWAGQHIDAAGARIRSIATRLHVEHLEATSGTGRLVLRGEVDPAAGRYAVHLDIVEFPVQPIRLGEGDTIDVTGRVTLTLDGAGTFARPAGRGSFTWREARYHEWVPGEVRGELEVDDTGAVRVEALLRPSGLALTATVAVAAPHAYTLGVAVERADLPTLLEAAGTAEAARRQVRGSLTMGMVIRGSLADQQDTEAVVDVTALDGAVFGMPFALLEPARIELSPTRLDTSPVALRLRGSTLRLDGGLAEDGHRVLRLDLAGSLEDVAPLVTRATGRATLGTGDLEVRVELSGPPRAPRLAGTATVTGGRLQVDGWPAVTAVGLDARVESGVFLVDALRARVDGGHLEVVARLPLGLFEQLPDAVRQANPAEGPADLRIMASGFPLAAFLRGPATTDLDARFDLRGGLVAPTLAAQAVEGRLIVERGTLAIGEVRLQQDSPADIVLGDGHARFSEWRWTGPRTNLAASGALDYGGSTLTYDVTLRGPVDLALLGVVLPGRTAGRLQVDLRGVRQDGRVSVTGTLGFADGAWVDRDSQVALSGLTGDIRLLGDRLSVDGLSGRLNGGQIALTGAMAFDLEQGSLAGAVGITARRVAFEWPAGVYNELDADLQIGSRGPVDRPFTVTGEVLVAPGVLRSSLRELALLAIETPPAPPTPALERRRQVLSQVGLDFGVRTRDDLVADSNELRAQLGAAVRVTGTLAEPGLVGRAEIRADGELYLAGRVYEILGGEIDFVDPSRIAPRINLIGRTQVSDYEVRLQLTGPPERLDVRLRSTPPLSQSDLASLLTTGQTARQRREQSEQAASEAARAQLLAAVSSEYLGAIGRWFGIDTIRIENTTRDLSATDLDPVARLSVTKNLGPALSVVYSQSLETSDDIAWIVSVRPGWRGVEAKSVFTGSRGEAYEVRQELLFEGGLRTRVAPPRRPRRPAAPRVSEVTVTGVPPEEAALLTRRLALKAGRRFDVYHWQRDRARIERYYRDRDRLRATVAAIREPSADGSRVALGYVVDRGPVVELAVEGYPFDRPGTEALRQAAAASPIPDFVPEAVTEAARLALVRDGHVTAVVTTRYDPVDEDRRALTVRVEPGPRAESRELAFTGNRTFRAVQLTALLADAGLSDRVWVRPDLAVALLASAHAAAGLLDVRIAPGQPAIDGRRGILPIAIDEGRAYRIRAVSVEGARQVSEADVVEALGLPTGAVFTREASTRALDAVASLLARLGHADAQVRMDTAFDRDRAQVDIRVRIDEGPRRLLTEVTTAGDTRTRAALLERALATVPPGTPADPQRIDAAQRTLYDLGIFRSVEPRLEPVGEPAATADGGTIQPVRLVFDLEEYARYRLRYGLQVSTAEVTTSEIRRGEARFGATLDLRHSNLFGTGFDIGAGGFFGADRSRLRALAQSTTLGGRPVQTTATLTRDATTTSGITLDLKQVTTTFAAEQRWRLPRRVELVYGYDLEFNQVDFVVRTRDALPLLLALSARRTSLFTTTSFDSRDNLLDPRRGMFHSASVEIGRSWLASQLDYVSYLGQHTLFVPVRRLTLATALRFGTVAIAPAQADSLEAVLVRFRAGGGTTVRGYRQDQLTPEIVPGLLRGGDVLVIANQEARLALSRYLAVVGFVDAGRAFATWRDVAWADLAVGVGTGLRVITPIGVIRVDVGFPRPRPSGSPRARWHFSFGHAF